MEDQTDLDLNNINKYDYLRNLDHINQKTPLIYNNDTDTSSIKNIILIHDEVCDYNKFITASNTETYPIIYNLKSSKDDLKELLKDKFQKIDRIALITHNSGIDNLKEFIDNKPLYTYDDLKEDVTEYSDNLKFMIDLVKEFNISNLDYLACNTLQYDNWNKYYSILNKESNVIIGASNDLTGNLKYGGDWVLESVNQDIRDIYFTSILENYQYTLDTTNISQNGGTIYIRQITTTPFNIQYSSDQSTWTTIGWPCTITNNTPAFGTILNVQFTTDITFSNTIGSTSGYFIIGSDYITINGANKVVTINGITDYPGLIQNGTSISTSSKTNITIQNIGVVISNNATLASNGGWIAQRYFGKGISSGTITVTNSYSTGSIGQLGGGIYGEFAGRLSSGGNISATNCYSTGAIGIRSGGIYGAGAGYSATGGSISATNCYSTGTIGQDGGGIYGYGTRYSATGSISATNCYSTGAINTDGGGIYGSYAGFNSSSPTISATYCYSTGTIATNGGGIYGSYTGYNSSAIISATNCYTIGTITTLGNGIYGSNKNRGTTSNCISSGDSTWIDANATSTIGNNSTNTNWLDYSSSTNIRWLLSTFKAAIYNPNNQNINYLQGGSSQPGSFTTNYKYLIVTTSPSTSSITINQTTGVLTFPSNLTVGTYTIYVLVGLLSNNVYYAYNYNTYTLTINKASQSITFNSIPIKTYGDLPFTLNGNASSGLTVSYGSSNSNVGTISDNTLTIVGCGTSIITASQEGDSNYNSATPVPQTLTVNKASQSITFNSIPIKTYGDLPFTLNGTTSSGLTVSYGSSNSNVGTISGNTLTIVGCGTSIITASQEGDSNYNSATPVPQTLTVNKASQSITFNSIPTKTYGDPPFTLYGTASSGLTVSYGSSNSNVGTISDNTLTIVGGGTSIITASQAGDSNYNPATDVPQTLTVNSSLSITEQPLSQTTAVGEDIYLTVKATSSSTISYSWYKDSISIKDTDKSTLSLYDANSSYNGAYYCKVTSNSTSINSSNAIVRVLYPNIPNPTVMPNPPNAVNKNIKY